MARLTHTSGGIVPVQKRNSGKYEEYNGGAAAAPVAMQGRNSVASINSGYNETAPRSNPRGNGNAQILSGTGDTGYQQFVILENDHYYRAANLQSQQRGRPQIPQQIYPQ